MKKEDIYMVSYTREIHIDSALGPYTERFILKCIKSSRTEAPTGRTSWLNAGTCLVVLACFGAACWFGVRFVRAENGFWPLSLHLATQVRAPGAGDVAWT